MNNRILIFVPGIKHQKDVCQKGAGNKTCKCLQYDFGSGRFVCKKLFNAFMDNNVNTLATGENCDANVVITNIRRFLRSSIGKKAIVKNSETEKSGVIRGFSVDRKKKKVDFTIQPPAVATRPFSIALSFNELKINEKDNFTKFQSVETNASVKVFV